MEIVMARFDRTTKQTQTRNTTYSAIVGSAAFQLGVRDYQLCRPFREAVDVARMFPGVRGAVWNYERGRLYAASCAGKQEEPLPSRANGRYVNRSLISHFAAMYVRKEVL
jgi:hypothetical protein